MLSSNWQVTLRLTTYRFRNIRGQIQNWGPKFRIRGSAGVPPPKGEKICLGPMSQWTDKWWWWWCTVLQNFTPIGATVAEIICNQTEKKTATNRPFRTNRWRVIIKDCTWGIVLLELFTDTKHLCLCYYKRRIVDCIIKLISQGRMSALVGGWKTPVEKFSPLPNEVTLIISFGLDKA